MHPQHAASLPTCWVEYDPNKNEVSATRGQAAAIQWFICLAVKVCAAGTKALGGIGHRGCSKRFARTHAAWAGAHVVLDDWDVCTDDERRRVDSLRDGR